MCPELKIPPEVPPDKVLDVAMNRSESEGDSITWP
ncbi:hypothetical protein SAMN05216267_10587 [Actinacidiphila rubida]|uniref:Uncharacterized protein n=1 Tax=Actinacidiphila rubida TaxID=310780 RepID=A0A1H8TT56_9ACTN|nr:hypothetical protein SAMN05216267_10587 [Actinacidiphila rubida]